MVVSRIRQLVLIKKTVTHGDIDDTVQNSYETVTAHVTEVNGAQKQTDLFGKQYAMTWVARVRGNHQADAVALAEPGKLPRELPQLDVIQIRKHALRTDIYFADDREVNANELEQ